MGFLSTFRHKGAVIRHKKMESSLVLITPDIAKQMLEENKANRKLEADTVTKYSLDMREGRWIDSNDIVRFSDRGVLLDGQHRLSAIIESRAPGYYIVTTNVPHEAAATIGEVKKWTHAQVLARDGEVHAPDLSTAIGWIWAIETKSPNGARGLSAVKKKQILAAHPSLKKWVGFRAKNKTFKRLFNAPVCAVAALFEEKYGEEKCLKFMRQLSDGSGLEIGDPAHTLREAAMKSDFKKQSSTSIIYASKAFSAFGRNEKLKMLRRFEGDKYPPI
jgi:hypothetical protein